MKSFDSKFKRVFAYVGLFILAAVIIFEAYLVYLYEKNNLELSARIWSLENQVASLGSTLATSASLGESNAKQIQEIAKRDNASVGRPVPNTSQSQESQLTAAVAKAAPAVVSIIVSKGVPLLEVKDYVDPFGDDADFYNSEFKVPVFGEAGTTVQEVGAGSGFILTSDGYILTNNHVVSDTDAQYTVQLASGEKKSAQVVHRDSAKDIAILKISGEKYSNLQLGDSSDLKLGQTVAAIGNALGEYDNSVSVGIISGLNRTIEAVNPEGDIERMTGVVQTDAAINRGNSGGPLLDLSGRAVGINVAMELGANNISFAIPINEIKPVIERVIP